MADPWFGLSGGNSLHSWLIESEYVKFSDDEGNKKKRKTKKSTRDDSDINRSSSRNMDFKETPASLAEVAVGRRKYRRWMNERLLRDLAGPLDAAAIGDLYAPPPWGVRHEPTTLERVTAPPFERLKDPQIWEPFIMGHDFERFMERASKVNGSENKLKPGLSSWRCVEKGARDALKRSKDWPLLIELEDKLVDYIETEDSQMEVDMIPLVMELDSRYQSLLVHGICQFHGLFVEPVGVEGALESTCTLRIHRRGQAFQRRDHCRVVEFLRSQ